MERKDFDRKHREAGANDVESKPEEKDARTPGGSSSLESMMSDMGYTDEGAAEDFERQGDVTDFSRKSHEAEFTHEPQGREFTMQGGGSGSQQGGGTGPKPYAGGQSGISSGSSGHLTGGSMDFGSSRYVGLAKIAKHMGTDVHQLRYCAQSQGILPDKHKRSCDMFSQDKAYEIMQACGTLPSQV